MSVVCHNCGEEYTNIGLHWSMSDCNYPRLSDYQKELITGILMGDGNIDAGRKETHNPRFRVSVINKEYLEWLDDKLESISNGVKLRTTAEEGAKANRERGFRPSAEAEDYHDLYQLTTTRLPALEQYRAWYDSGEKVWPDNLELTPTVLKHWYCTDGSWNNSAEYVSNIRLCMLKESENTEKVTSYFKAQNLPIPSYVQSTDGCLARFDKEQSKELWKYMGEPIPGFEYKWPNEYTGVSK